MKRNQLLIGGAAVLVIVLLWYFLIYAPLGDDLSSAQAQTSAEQKKTDSLQADLARLQSQAKNASQQQAKLRALDAAVPKNPDLAEFIIQANDIADSSGISFLSIAPTPPAAGAGGASVINMTISISGSFYQLQEYLRQLEQLERLVVVDGISISSSSGGSASTTGGSSTTDTSGTGEVSLSVSLTARMFTRAAPTDTSGSTGSAGSGTGSTTTTTVPGGSTSSTTATTATTAAPNAAGGT